MKLMRVRNLFIYLIVTIALAAPEVPAQLGPAKASGPDNGRFGDPTIIGHNLQGDLYGVVKKIDDKEIILDKTMYGEDQTIQLDHKTKYVRDGKRSGFDKLKVGDAVYVDVKTEKKTGIKTAKKVISGLIATP